MKKEEAIERIREHIRIHFKNEPYAIYISEALYMGIEALEKQIPKKPIATDEQHIRYSMNYICPLCGKHFSGTGISSYRYHCGQALDWNDHQTEKGGVQE